MDSDRIAVLLTFIFNVFVYNFYCNLAPRSKRRRIGDDLMASGGKMTKVGSAELTRLWNLNPDNMDACKADSRVFLPKLDDLFANAVEQADPEAMVEEQYK